MTEKNIIEIIKHASENNRITCAGAFAISQKESVFPDILGIAIDEAGVKICECQMGLFGCSSGNKIVKPAETVSEELEDMIFSYLDLEDGKLSCQAAWEIAAELKIRKIDVACACEKLEIKINRCQLGAF
jgi:hypothetical protein